MKTVHKLILKSYAGPMVLTFFIVLFVFIMQFMWRYIDELVGKGLGMDVILELMMYAAVTLIPMVLPLATLFAAVMTMGNMGENYELLALKSAGISLPKIMRPLIILVLFVAVGSFFVANNLVPIATKKISALLYDIRQQKQSIEFKDGLFFNGMDDISIRVDRQDPKTKLLNGVLIYDTSDPNGNMTTTLADSGYISLSDDKKYLLVTLYSGERYEQARGYKWFDNSELRQNIFDVYNMVMKVPGFDFERTDQSMFNGSQTKNVRELQAGIDSLEKISSGSASASYEPLLNTFIFPFDKSLASDSIPHVDMPRAELAEKIENLPVRSKVSIYDVALNKARNSRSYYSFDEATSKEALNQLYRYKVEWHKKMSLPVSIMIFFLIGAPLGAIIRKGGLGMPVVVSVGFFVIYYIITITGEKMAREGSWDSFLGMWIATFILLPISVYLTYKATNDSNLFNAEWYLARYKKISAFFRSLFRRNALRGGLPPAGTAGSETR